MSGTIRSDTKLANIVNYHYGGYKACPFGVTGGYLFVLYCALEACMGCALVHGYNVGGDSFVSPLLCMQITRLN